MLAQATGHLVDDGHHRALWRTRPSIPSGTPFVGVGVASARFLKVAVGAALLHGANAAHGAITFVAATLVGARSPKGASSIAGGQYRPSITLLAPVWPWKYRRWRIPPSAIREHARATQGTVATLSIAAVIWVRLLPHNADWCRWSQADACLHDHRRPPLHQGQRRRAVAMYPPITSTCGWCLLDQRTRSMTPRLCPCAVSTTIRVNPGLPRLARSSVPAPTPTAAPRRRPAASRAALGKVQLSLVMSQKHR